MDEKERKIQELERELKGLRQEVDALKRGSSQLQYETEPPRPGSETLWYGQQPAAPKARPVRVVLIAVGCLAALAALAAVMVLVALTLINTIDKDTTVMAEELLGAVVERDVDNAYALVYPDAMTRDEFDREFETLCAIWSAGGGGDTFALRRTSYAINTAGGVAHYTSVYEVSSGSARFTLRLDRMAHGETTGITGVRLSR